MLFHRCQNTEISLNPSGIVVADITADHADQLLLVCETVSVIPFPLENAPEALHGPVIDAMGDSGHTLCHTGLLQLVVEGAVCVLESPVGMEDGMGVGIAAYRPVKGFEHQRIIVVLADNKGNNASVIEIQDCTEIDLVYLDAFVPLELCNIRQPLLVGRLRVKISIQDVFCNMLRVLCASGASVIAVFDGGFDVFLPADSQDPFVVDMNVVVMAKIIVDPAIAFVRAFHVNLLDCLCNMLVFDGSGAFIARQPPVIGCSGHSEQPTGFFNGITAFLAAIPDCPVKVSPPYL